MGKINRISNTEKLGPYESPAKIFSEKLNMYKVCPVGSLAELSLIENPYLMITGRK